MTTEDLHVQSLLYTPFCVGGENRVSLFYTPREQGCVSERIAGARPVRLEQLYSVTPRERVYKVALTPDRAGVVA